MACSSPSPTSSNWLVNSRGQKLAYSLQLTRLHFALIKSETMTTCISLSYEINMSWKRFHWERRKCSKTLLKCDVMREGKGREVANAVRCAINSKVRFLEYVPSNFLFPSQKVQSVLLQNTQFKIHNWAQLFLFLLNNGNVLRGFTVDSSS